MNAPDELAIVIPAKNEAHNLPVLFESLLEQDYPAITTTRILVADADSTDGTPDVVRHYAERGILRTDVIPGGLPGPGRNAGTRASDSTWLLFVDADVKLGDRGIVRRALDAAKSRDLWLVSARLAAWNGTTMDHVYYRGCNAVVWCSRYTRPFAPGAFMLWQREAFVNLGMFDERAHFAEDYQLSRQVPGRRFALVDGPVLADNRRFRKTGYLKMAMLFLRTALYGRNPEYFRTDRGYWK